jgi:hypothetical protein
MATFERQEPQSRTHRPAAKPGETLGSPLWWRCVLNVALVLWILRVPVTTTGVGWPLLRWTVA